MYLHVKKRQVMWPMELHTLKPYEESPVEEDVDPNDPRNDTTEDFDID